MKRTKKKQRPKRPARKKHPAPKLHAFLSCIREYPNISYAAKAARIARSTHYKRYDTDPDYAKLFDQSWRWGMGLVRDCASQRIIHGIEEPVIYKGKYQYVGRGKNRRLVTIRKYPERLHMRVLSGEFPEVYNRQRLEVSAPGGGPVQNEHSIKIEFVSAPPRPQERDPDEPAPAPHDPDDPQDSDPSPDDD